MKKIFTVIMVVFACLAINAQEVHGYSNAIAKKLDSVGFGVIERGYSTDVTGKISAKLGENDKYYPKSDVYGVMLATPKYYDLEQSQIAIENVLNQYSDVRLVVLWQTTPHIFSAFPSAKHTYAVYQCDDTVIFIGIVNVAETYNSYSTDYCTVVVYEYIVGEE